MALLKDIEVKNTGVVASYWKIAELHINWHLKTATVVLWGFKDQQSRENGKAPLDQRIFEFDSSSFPFTVDRNNVAEAYEAIKSYKYPAPEGVVVTSEFADAQDV